MSDEWGGRDAPGAAAVTFTQYHADLSAEFTRHAASPEITRASLTRAAWQVSPVPTWQVTRHTPGFQLSQVPWTAENLKAHLVRTLRRCGRASAAQLERRAYLTGPAAERLGAFLAFYWAVFTPCEPDTWTLTPWTRLDVPFDPRYVSYEQSAAQFWVAYQHIPSPDEEWHPGVRAAVSDHLNAPALPPYFQVRSGGSGPFMQPHLGRWRALTLRIDALPEGLYWTQGGVTFSVSGRALFREDARGPVVATATLERAFRTALLAADTVTWHPAGAAFLAACRASQVTPASVW